MACIHPQVPPALWLCMPQGLKNQRGLRCWYVIGHITIPGQLTGPGSSLPWVSDFLEAPCPLHKLLVRPDALAPTCVSKTSESIPGPSLGPKLGFPPSGNREREPRTFEPGPPVMLKAQTRIQMPPNSLCQAGSRPREANHQVDLHVPSREGLGKAEAEVSSLLLSLPCIHHWEVLHDGRARGACSVGM